MKLFALTCLCLMCAVFLCYDVSVYTSTLTKLLKCVVVLSYLFYLFFYFFFRQREIVNFRWIVDLEVEKKVLHFRFSSGGV